MSFHEEQFTCDELILRYPNGDPMTTITGEFECLCEWDNDADKWTVERAHGAFLYTKPERGILRTKRRWNRIDNNPECAIILRALSEYVQGFAPPEMAYVDPNAEHRQTYAQVR